MKSVTQTSNALAQGSATQRQSPLALSLSLSPRAAQPPPASAVRGADGKGQYNHFHSPSTRCGCCELWNGLAVAKKHSWGRWMTSVKRLTAHIITQKIKTCFTRTLKRNPKKKSQRRFCDSIHSKNFARALLSCRLNRHSACAHPLASWWLSRLVIPDCSASCFCDWARLLCYDQRSSRNAPPALKVTQIYSPRCSKTGSHFDNQIWFSGCFLSAQVATVFLNGRSGTDEVQSERPVLVPTPHELFRIHEWTQFHSQDWSISNFPCSLTRNTTSHNNRFGFSYSLLGWKKLYYIIN